MDDDEVVVGGGVFGWRDVCRSGWLFIVSMGLIGFVVLWVGTRLFVLAADPVVVFGLIVFVCITAKRYVQYK